MLLANASWTDPNHFPTFYSTAPLNKWRAAESAMVAPTVVPIFRNSGDNRALNRDSPGKVKITA